MSGRDMAGGRQRCKHGDMADLERPFSVIRPRLKNCQCTGLNTYQHHAVAILIQTKHGMPQNPNKII